MVGNLIIAFTISEWLTVHLGEKLNDSPKPLLLIDPLALCSGPVISQMSPAWMTITRA